MKSIHFYHFDSEPRFLLFLLYVSWKSGVTFVRKGFRDVMIVSFSFDIANEKCFSFLYIYLSIKFKLHFYFMSDIFCRFDYT